MQALVTRARHGTAPRIIQEAINRMEADPAKMVVDSFAALVERGDAATQSLIWMHLGNVGVAP